VMVGWCGQSGDGGWGARSSAHEGEGAGAKKFENRARWLGFGCAVANGSGGRLEVMVGLVWSKW